MTSRYLFWSLLIIASAAAAETSRPEVRDEIVTLKREIARHDDLYHRKAAPEIGDAEYDTLRQRLAALERQAPDAARATPRLAEVGDDRSGLFQTYRHAVPMLGLEKGFTAADVRAFHARLVKSLGGGEIGGGELDVVDPPVRPVRRPRAGSGPRSGPDCRRPRPRLG